MTTQIRQRRIIFSRRLLALNLFENSFGKVKRDIARRDIVSSIFRYKKFREVSRIRAVGICGVYFGTYCVYNVAYKRAIFRNGVSDQLKFNR